MPKLDPLKTLTHALRLLRARPRALWALGGVTVAFGLAMAPASLQMQTAAEAPGTSPGEFFARLGPLWLALMGGSLVYWAATQAVYLRVLGDEAAGTVRPWHEVLGSGMRRFPALLLTTVAVLAVCYVGLVLCLAPGIFFGIAFSLAAPAVVLGPAGPFEAMAQAWRLSRGSRGTLGLALLLAGALYLVVAFLGAIAVLLLPKVAGDAGFFLGTAIANALYAPGIALIDAVLVAAWLQRSGTPIGAASGSRPQRDSQFVQASAGG